MSCYNRCNMCEHRNDVDVCLTDGSAIFAGQKVDLLRDTSECPQYSEIEEDVND